MNLNVIIIFITVISIIISFIPNFTINILKSFNNIYIRSFFIIYITYLSFNRIDNSVSLTILFLIMLEISNRINLNKI